MVGTDTVTGEEKVMDVHDVGKELSREVRRPLSFPKFSSTALHLPHLRFIVVSFCYKVYFNMMMGKGELRSV